MNYKSQAFTLLELLLAIAISTIIMTMGYPTYISYETHAQRNQAEVALHQLAGNLESYFTDNGTYAGATFSELGITELEQDLHYHLVLANLSDAHFEIDAVPQDAQAAHDTQCGTLILSDTNDKKISGSGDAKTCWG